MKAATAGKLIVLALLVTFLAAGLAAVLVKSDDEDTVEHQAQLVQRDVEAASTEEEKTPAPKPKPSSRDPEGTEIPRSVAGDKGRYYLLERKRKGDIVSALHKRVGVDAVGWTRTETNCKRWRMRELGYTEESPEKMKREPTKWFELVEGSSKSDLAHFVCR